MTGEEDRRLGDGLAGMAALRCATRTYGPPRRQLRANKTFIALYDFENVLRREFLCKFSNLFKQFEIFAVIDVWLQFTTSNSVDFFLLLWFIIKENDSRLELLRLIKLPT